ncbi:MAG: NUDIX hydrolase [Clostridia bacterium]|nr:NUDIX hydrolase [Clostridia bacterium]
MKLKEIKKSSETIYEGKVITVERDIAILENGAEAVREVVRHPGGVGVVAMDNEGYVYMVRQFRYPFYETTLEIPAGKLDRGGEDTRQAGIRELREETGLVADNIEYLGDFYATPGFCDEKLAIYFATGLHQGDTDPDEDEFVECEKYHIDELVEMINRGEIKDAKSVIGILMTKNKL